MQFHTFHDAYSAMLQRLATGPSYRNAPRGFASIEHIGVQYSIRDARQRAPMIPARRLSLVFNFAESLWYLSGRDDLDFIAYYAPSMSKYSADGNRLTGTAYGRAIFGGSSGEDDQWGTIVRQLREDPDSKRAVLQIFGAEELRIPANPDVSCTLGLQFLIRDGALHAVGFMRANDCYRGMASDVFSFTFLQEMLATQLGLELGSYVHTVGSLHIYDTDRDRVSEVLADPAAAAAPRWAFPAMPFGDNWPYVHQVLRYEEALRLNQHRLDLSPEALGLPEYWRQLLLLLEFYRRVRHDERIDEELTSAFCPPFGWLMACWRPQVAAAVQPR